MPENDKEGLDSVDLSNNNDLLPKNLAEARDRIQRALDLIMQEYRADNTPMAAVCELAVRIGDVRSVLEGRL